MHKVPSVSPSLFGEIEAAIDAEDWSRARNSIETALESEPRSHWLVTRLGLTYYEQYDYELALQNAQSALEIALTYPLAIWDCAGSVD